MGNKISEEMIGDKVFVVSEYDGEYSVVRDRGDGSGDVMCRARSIQGVNDWMSRERGAWMEQERRGLGLQGPEFELIVLEEISIGEGRFRIIQREEEEFEVREMEGEKWVFRVWHDTRAGAERSIKEYRAREEEDWNKRALKDHLSAMREYGKRVRGEAAVEVVTGRGWAVAGVVLGAALTTMSYAVRGAYRALHLEE